MPTLYFLVGATAAGKTDVALELAGLLPVEIVSLDSMSVYRGMDIGTAKPSAAARARVPHHLIDVAAPTESFSVGRYVEAADAVIGEIRARGKLPLLVGGTPLYLKVMTTGLFSAPEVDPAVRAALHARAEREGSTALHAELAGVDPASAERIHPNDLKRIVRALEVHRTTGQPISALQTQWDAPRGDRTCVIAGIARERSELYKRIEARVDAMFEDGLVDEVRGLLDRFGTLGREASQAVGYREVLAHLAGETDLATTVARVKRNTRRMAKRQLTWFRSIDAIRWFAMDASTSSATVAREIRDLFDASAASSSAAGGRKG